MRSTDIGETVQVEQASSGEGISREIKLKILRLMLNARCNDDASLAMKRRGQLSFHLSAAGHEGMCSVALAMQPTDWLHPYYRDRAMALARGVTHEQLFLEAFGKKTGASAGRQMPEHYNSRELRIVCVSTPVAANLLPAVGMAMSLKERHVPDVVVAAIGDAATREGEMTEAIAQAVVDNLAMVFVVEDNGYGISTPTHGKTFWTLPHSLADGPWPMWFHGCRVELVDGLDPLAVYSTAAEALERARQGQGPSCLIARVERLQSHSSSDDQRIYRSPEELKELHAKDPVKRYCERCLQEKWVSEEELERLKAEAEAEVAKAIERARAAPEPEPESVHGAFASLPADLPRSEQNLPGFLEKRAGGLTMAQCINTVLEQEMRRNQRVVIFGEDVEDPKGDVFGTTRGLTRKFPGRVRNSPLAEATILGAACGRALAGDVPVATMQFIDFIGPGLNQLVNQVATLYWRSLGQFNCPMVILSPYGGYLPGLGPWHSQTNEAIYAHLPGLHVVIPSCPEDAAGLLRFALRCNRPVLYLFPKAQLHSADATVQEPPADCLVPFGCARLVSEGRDATIVTWGNCVPLSRRAAAEAAKEGWQIEILDLRTVSPWDSAAVLKSVAKTGRLLVVHEDAKTCGLGGEIIAETTANCFQQLRATPMRVTKSDDHNPTNFRLELSVLPSAEQIFQAVRELCRQDFQPRGQTQSIAPAGGSAAERPQSAVAAPATPAPRAPAAEKSVDIVVTRQSPTDEDAVVVRFLVQAGQTVQVGTPLVELEANKGAFEVESTHAGTVTEIRAKPGERVRMESEVLLRLEVSGTAGEAAVEPTVAAFREVHLSPAQLQVGALALKSQREIPAVSVETEADVTELVRQREELKGDFENKFKLRLTYTHLILWTLVQTMMEERFAGFRGRLSAHGERLRIDAHAQVGFAAVGPNDDLFTPVIKQADTLEFIPFARRAQELTEKVRAGNVSVADLQDATVTLTNIGALEVTGGTPFVIPGQVAILTASSLLERPRVVRDRVGTPAVQARMVLNLKLVFDHRPFNGLYAAGFLKGIKHRLERLRLEALVQPKAVPDFT